MQFHVKFTDIDGQIQMAEHLRTRSMLKNPLACDGMDYDVVENHKPLSACLLCLPFSFSQDVLDFPTDNEEWDEIKLEDLEAHRQQWGIPILDKNRTTTALNDISLGTYRLVQMN